MKNLFKKIKKCFSEALLDSLLMESVRYSIKYYSLAKELGLTAEEAQLKLDFIFDKMNNTGYEDMLEVDRTFAKLRNAQWGYILECRKLNMSKEEIQNNINSNSDLLDIENV